MCVFQLRTDISFVSFNTRGLKDSVKRKAVFLFCKGQQAHCTFLQETHSDKSDVKFWTQQWGDKILFSHGTNRSAGVAICFNRCPGKILSERVDQDGHWVACVLEIDTILIILINIYGYNNDQKNRNLLHQISTVITELNANFPTDHIMVGGDFNLTPDEWMDRWPSKLFSEHRNPILEDFVNNNRLIDIWRMLHREVKQFTWHKPNGQSKSRIDYWLVSNSISDHVKDTEIANCPLSDHCIINLRLKNRNSNNKPKDYWKFNSQLLKNSEFCRSIKTLILDIQNDDSIDKPILKWEYLKFSIRKHSITFGKKLNKEKKPQEASVVKELMTLYSKLNWSEEDKERINHFQSKLDEMYINKANGAYIRSRARWIEEGEKNTAYFCKLEKRRQEYNSICSLVIDGEECTEPKRIANKVLHFYRDLYKSSYSEQNASSFFDTINNLIPIIDDNFKEICDEELRIAEFDCAIERTAFSRTRWYNNQLL